MAKTTIEKLEAQGFEDVVIEEATYVEEYSSGRREYTDEPFAVAHTLKDGMVLVKNEMLGWSGEGYAHVSTEIRMPGKVREALEDFLGRVRARQ